MHQPAATSLRRHDLDWLRVGVFLLLILYHIGMFYVPWGWHVKSQHAPVTALELPMLLTSGWRLPLLFFISGVALRYALVKAPPWPLLRRRVVLLLVPLLFGMYVICAPQAWHELVQKGFWSGGVVEFYRHYAAFPWASPADWPILTPTWNHLWYLLYVLVYSLVLIVAYGLARGSVERASRATGLGRAVLILLPLVNLLLVWLLRDSIGRAQTLYGDWYNLATSFMIMSAGFLLAPREAFWQVLRSLRWGTLAIALGLSLALILARNGVAPFDLGGDAQYHYRLFQGWAMLWALLGWGQVWLQRDTPLLRYLSGAVFTYYVLHQSIIIMIGAPLTRLGWPLWAEMGTLLLGTALGCWAGYHLLARHMGRFGILLGARNG